MEVEMRAVQRIFTFMCQRMVVLSRIHRVLRYSMATWSIENQV